MARFGTSTPYPATPFQPFHSLPWLTLPTYLPTYLPTLSPREERVTLARVVSDVGDPNHGSTMVDPPADHGCYRPWLQPWLPSHYRRLHHEATMVGGG